MDVLESPHVVIQQGRVVMVQRPDGTKVPLPDDQPKLDAAAAILKIQERRARLIGLDAPVRHRVQVVPQDAVEAAIADLKRERLMDEDDDVAIGDLL